MRAGDGEAGVSAESAHEPEEISRQETIKLATDEPNEKVCFMVPSGGPLDRMLGKVVEEEISEGANSGRAGNSKNVRRLPTAAQLQESTVDEGTSFQ